MNLRPLNFLSTHMKHLNRNPKPEIRSPKEIRNSKSDGQYFSAGRICVPVTRAIAGRFFGIRPSSFFRISKFGLRISLLAFLLLSLASFTRAEDLESVATGVNADLQKAMADLTAARKEVEEVRLPLAQIGRAHV